jgi:hypothetical protein
MLRENRQPYFGLLGRDQISPVGVPWEQQWMHLVFQHTGEFQQIWINGRLVASFRAEPYHGTTGVTAIGKAPRWGNVPAQDFVGHMRDVRIYQRRLEPDEIASLASAFQMGQPISSTTGVDDRASQLPGAAMALSPTLAAMLPEDPSRPFLEIDGQQITINGRPGQVYVLEGSTDLRNWVPLERGGSQTGTLVYQDPDRDSAMRFYRVRVEEEGALMLDVGNRGLFLLCCPITGALGHGSSACGNGMLSWELVFGLPSLREHPIEAVTVDV